MRIGVLGAGSIGCTVGGRLAAAGHDVVFVGRRSLGDEIAAHGLTLTSWRGDRVRVDAVRWTDDAAALGEVELALVAVKGTDTEAAGDALALVLGSDVPVLSLQNGVRNADVLRERLGTRAVWPCMVPFNVVRAGDGRFHQGTSGELTTSPEVPAPIRNAFAEAGLPLHLHPDVSGVLWGKLLINLNNALNALSGLPLREQLGDRGWRTLMSLAIAEGLAVLRAAGIRPIAFLPVPLWAVVHVLRLPTWLFTRVARAMVAVDPHARSSMWEDLQRGRPTEIAQLNGEVVALGAALGIPTPINTAIVEAIRAAERREDVADRVRVLRAMAP